MEPFQPSRPEYHDRISIPDDDVPPDDVEEQRAEYDRRYLTARDRGETVLASYPCEFEEPQ